MDSSLRSVVWGRTNENYREAYRGVCDYLTPVPCLTDSRSKVREPALVRLVGSRKLKHPLRAIAEAIFFQLRTGCQWAELPRERFPPAGTVYRHFRKWADAYVLDRLNALLVKRLRALPPAGDAPATGPEPTACVLDS